VYKTSLKFVQIWHFYCTMCRGSIFLPDTVYFLLRLLNDATIYPIIIIIIWIYSSSLRSKYEKEKISGKTDVMQPLITFNFSNDMTLWVRAISVQHRNFLFIYVLQHGEIHLALLYWVMIGMSPEPPIRLSFGLALVLPAAFQLNWLAL